MSSLFPIANIINQPENSKENENQSEEISNEQNG